VSELGSIADFDRAVWETRIARSGTAIAVHGASSEKEGAGGTIRVYSLPDAKARWTRPLGQDQRDGPLCVDPQGKMFAFAFGRSPNTRTNLLPIDTLQPKDLPIVPDSLGPAGHWITSAIQDPDTGTLLGFGLHRGGETTPVVTIPSARTGHGATFNTAGTHFAWGTVDGTVIVCDIAAVQTKLAEIRMGW